MKRILLVVLAAFFCGSVGAAGSAPAADFYVAANGNDRAAGTFAAPFATLDRACAAVRDLKQRDPGRATPIIVMVRGGEYFLSSTLTFTAADSGTAQAPVVYAAYPGEKPVISGGREIKGWKQDPKTKYWVAALPSDFQNFEQLFVNGERRYRPRTTKSGYLYIAGPVFSDKPSPVCRQVNPGQQGYQCFDRFRFRPGDLKETYSNITDVEINDFEIWTMAKLRLKSVDTAQNIAYLTGPTAVNHDAGFMARHRYLVENVKEALSEPGEWYLDRGATPWTLTYIPKPGETIANTHAIAPQLSQLIVAEDLNYVTFKGLTFEHTNWVVPAEGHESHQTESYPDRRTGKMAVPAALSFTKSSYVALDGCTVAHIGGWGVEFVGRGEFNATPVNQVVNSAVYDLGAGGIRIGGVQRREDTEESVAQHNVVRNTVVAGGGRILPAGIGTGIWVGNSHHNVVSHNDVYDFYSGGIGLCVPAGLPTPLPHDNLIEFNHVYQMGQGVTSDFGGIYIVGFRTTGNKVMNNKIHDVIHFPDLGHNGGEGIYVDNITSNVTVMNNLVYRVTHSAIFNNRGMNNTWANNILAYGRNGMVQRGTDDLDSLSFRFTNNIVYFTGPIQTPIPHIGQFFGPGPLPEVPQQRAGTARARQMAMPTPKSEQNDPVPGGTPPRRRGGVQWDCAKNDDTPAPCASRFLFDSNLYGSPAGKAPVFVTSAADDPLKAIEHSFAEWQALGEDVHSLNRDPLFVNPEYPADDFRLRPDSPASQIGFVPFDASQAGRTSAELKPPPVPHAFPVLVLDPIEDYHQPSSLGPGSGR
jgi:hypothetical protein